MIQDIQNLPVLYNLFNRVKKLSNHPNFHSNNISTNLTHKVESSSYSV